MKKLFAYRRWTIIFLIVFLSLTATMIYIGSAQSANPMSVMTDTMMMTGRSSEPIKILTDTMTMTGRSSQPVAVTTDTMMMTGRR
jgi:hypothetical protein